MAGFPAKNEERLTAGLYIVATPIGNLSDISLRALDVLKKADVIACEDTRTSAVLLKAYGIATPTISCHEHNENRAGDDIIHRITGGQSVALISDAGTPLISDPGYRLVRMVQEKELYVTTIPGASSLTAAITISGLPSDNFMFAGFLPPKHEARVRKLKSLAAVPATMIFLEAPHRISETLNDMALLWPEREAAVVREISKKFEQVIRLPLAELADFYAENEARGEMVLLLAPPENKPVDENEWLEVLKSRIEQVPLSQAVAEVAENFSIARKTVYAAALKIKL